MWKNIISFCLFNFGVFKMKLKNLFENWNYYLKEELSSAELEDLPLDYNPETGKPYEPDPEDVPDVGPNPEEEAEEEAQKKEPEEGGFVSQIYNIQQKVFNHFKDRKKIEKLIQPLLVGKVIQKISRRGRMSENIISEAPINPSNFTMNPDRAVNVAIAALETGLPMHMIMAIYAKESGGEITPRGRFALEGYVFHKLTKGAHLDTAPHVAGYGWKSPTEPVIRKRRLGWHYEDLVNVFKKTGGMSTNQRHNYRKVMSLPAEPGSDFAKRKKLYKLYNKKGYSITTVSRWYRHRNLPDGYEHINRFFKADFVKAVLSVSWGTAQVMGFNILSSGKGATSDNPKDVKEAQALVERYGFVLNNKNIIVDVKDKIPNAEKHSADDFVKWNLKNRKIKDRFLRDADIMKYGQRYNGSKEYAPKLAAAFKKMVKDYPPTALANLLSKYGEKETT